MSHYSSTSHSKSYTVLDNGLVCEMGMDDGWLKTCEFAIGITPMRFHVPLANETPHGPGSNSSVGEFS